MPIVFHCKECYFKVITPNETAGKQGRCPQCGGVISIPEAHAQPVPVDPARDTSDQNPAPSPPQTPIVRPANDPFKPTGQKTPAVIQPEPEPQLPEAWRDEKPEAPVDDENRWGSDEKQKEKMRKLEATADTKIRLAGVSQGLIISAGVNIGITALCIVGLIIYIVSLIERNAEFDLSLIAGLVIGLSIVMLTSMMIMIGGNHMRFARSYSTAWAGAIFAIMPLNLLFFATIPLGIWAISLLSEPDVKYGFKR